MKQTLKLISTLAFSLISTTLLATPSLTGFYGGIGANIYSLTSSSANVIFDGDRYEKIVNNSTNLAPTAQVGFWKTFDENKF